MRRTHLVFILIVCAYHLASAADEPSLADLKSAARGALQENKTEEVRRLTESIMQRFGNNADAVHFCGETRYRVGLVDLAVISFDREIEIQPQVKPYLWQRGLALYDAGKFDEARKQFESHRAVNPHDVENATWHYLCVAAIEGAEQAQKLLLPAPGDARAPMAEVYELYAGRMQVADVIAAAEKMPQATESGQSARFYAQLYVGLYHQVAGRIDEAKVALRESLNTGMTGYMADSARVRLQMLAKTGSDAKVPPEPKP